jgi:hypothetical protein
VMARLRAADTGVGECCANAIERCRPPVLERSCPPTPPSCAISADASGKERSCISPRSRPNGVEHCLLSPTSSAMRSARANSPPSSSYAKISDLPHAADPPRFLNSRAREAREDAGAEPDSSTHSCTRPRGMQMLYGGGPTGEHPSLFCGRAAACLALVRKSQQVRRPRVRGAADLGARAAGIDLRHARHAVVSGRRSANLTVPRTLWRARTAVGHSHPSASWNRG